MQRTRIARITSAVQSQIAADSTTQRSALAVTTINGIVILTGTVPAPNVVEHVKDVVQQVQRRARRGRHGREGVGHLTDIASAEHNASPGLNCARAPFRARRGALSAASYDCIAGRLTRSRLALSYCPQ